LPLRPDSYGDGDTKRVCVNACVSRGVRDATWTRSGAWRWRAWLCDEPVGWNDEPGAWHGDVWNA